MAPRPRPLRRGRAAAFEVRQFYIQTLHELYYAEAGETHTPDGPSHFRPFSEVAAWAKKVTRQHYAGDVDPQQIEICLRDDPRDNPAGQQNCEFLTPCMTWGGVAGSDPGRDIQAMVDQSKDISRATFMRHCRLGEIPEMLGYCRHASQGLTMAADWYVSYHRSRFCGVPCYYFVWSSIEHIFVDPHEWNRVWGRR